MIKHTIFPFLPPSLYNLIIKPSNIDHLFLQKIKPNSHMLMENHMICSLNTAASSSLPMHKNSQTISKPKPKIRIIHIFAPEIIKTDATNFRELVQRLTGKPTDGDLGGAAQTKARISRKKVPRIYSSNKKIEIHAEFRERVKGEEEEIWRGANSGGGFLGGFAEFDGFMQELNQFPFLEGTTQMQDVYGLSQLA